MLPGYDPYAFDQNDVNEDDLAGDAPLTQTQKDALHGVHETLTKVSNALLKHDFNLINDLLVKTLALQLEINNIVQVNRQDFFDEKYEGYHNNLMRINEGLAQIYAHIVIYRN